MRHVLPRMPKLQPTHVAWAAAYLVFIAAIIFGVFYARRRALEIYGTTSAQSEWETWREDATKMSKGAGPVTRRPPKSPQPPALLLMRDYFGICLSLSVVLSTILFATFMLFLQGAATTHRHRL